MKKQIITRNGKLYIKIRDQNGRTRTYRYNPRIPLYKYQEWQQTPKEKRNRKSFFQKWLPKRLRQKEQKAIETGQKAQQQLEQGIEKIRHSQPLQRYFKSDYQTYYTCTAEEARYSPEKIYKQVLEKALKEPDKLAKIVKQMDKVKEIFKFEIEWYGLVNGKEIRFLKAETGNKTLEELLQEMIDTGMIEGAKVESGKIENAMQTMNAEWTKPEGALKDEVATITRINIKTTITS